MPTFYSKLFWFSFSLLLIIFSLAPEIVFTHPQIFPSQIPSKIYEIPSMSIVVEVYPDGTFMVYENITVRYVHGTFSSFGRLIPLSDVDYVDFLSAKAYGVNLTGVRAFYNLQRVILTIYHRDVTVVYHSVVNPPREVTFMFNYRVYGGLKLIDSLQNSINWDPVGRDFEVAINSVSITLKIPGNISSRTLFKVDPTPQNIFYSDNYTTILFNYSNVPAYTGCRISVAFPKMYEPKPDSFLIIKDYPLEITLIVILFSTFGTFMFWYFKRRRFMAHFEEYALPSMVVQPSNLSPIEVSYLLNRELDYEAALSEILELARKGVLNIEYDEVKRNAFFSSTSSTEDALRNLRRYDLNVFDGDILRLALSYKNAKSFLSFFDDIQRDVEFKVESRLVERGYLKSRFKVKRILLLSIPVGLSIALIIASILMFSSPPLNPQLFSLFKALYVIVAGFGVGFLSMGLISFFMYVPYTAEGFEACDFWRNHLNYMALIKGDESGRILEKTATPQLFESYIPHLMFFDLNFIDEWLKRWIRYLPKDYSPSWFHVRGFEGKLDFQSFISAFKSYVESMFNVIEGLREALPYTWRFRRIFSR
jgi:hypothetical protein